MALKVSTPLEIEVPLSKADPTGETKVRIRQARQAEVEFVSSAATGYVRQITDPESGAVVSVRYPTSPAAMKRWRIEATLTGCNITHGDAEAPLFRFKVDPATGKRVLDMDDPTKGPSFAEAIGLLDPEIVDEIHEAVLSVNKRWAPRGE